MRHAAPPSRVALFYDVPGWAWWHRARQISRHLPSRYETEIFQVGDRFDHADFDLVCVFDSYLADHIGNVPPDKLILGCSSPIYLDWLREKSRSKPAAAFVNSRQMWEAIRGEGHYYLCQNGVDTELFRPAPASPDRTAACWVGNSRSLGEKGLDLIQAACELTGTTLITSDSDSMNTSIGMAQDKVRDAIYHRASFYICASALEGTPNPGLEALACGLPVISTRVGNMPEIIRDGFNGFLVERSMEAIAEAIGKLRGLDRDKLSNNARKSILDGWQWPQKVQAYAAMFDQALQRRRPL